MKAAILAASLCALVATDAGAQYGGSRHRSGSQGDSQQGEAKKCSEMPDDPFATVERELPSLSLDIGLTSAQVEAWSAFARDLQRHVETLYAMLSDAQKRLLDKRLILSQVDPLGK